MRNEKSIWVLGRGTGAKCTLREHLGFNIDDVGQCFKTREVGEGCGNVSRLVLNPCGVGGIKRNVGNRVSNRGQGLMLFFSFDFFSKPEKHESGGYGGRPVWLKGIDGRDSQGVVLHQLLIWRTSTDRDRLVVKM